MRRTSGFTLLEVMISIAIVGVMMTLIWTSTTQSLNTKDRTEKRDMVFHMGRVALRKISDDLIVAFLAKQAASTTTTLQASAGKGRVKTFFIGDDEGAQDQIKFTTLSQLRLFSDAKESDQCKVSYEVVSSEEEPGEMDLVRRKDPWLDNTTDVKGTAITLVENIREFSLEYYDPRKREWVKNWDSQKVDWRDRLPVAVRIKIIFPDPEEEDLEIPMFTAVTLALSKGAIEIQ